MLNNKSEKLKKWKLKDYLIFFFIVPLILFAIYLTPYEIKQNFILSVSSPTIQSIFISNYTHSEFYHLVYNLILYFLIIFLIFNIETDRKMFHKFSFVSFLILPLINGLFILYLIPIFLPQIKFVQGFSTILTAFIAYILFCSYTYVKNSWKLKLNQTFFWLLVSINLLLAIVLEWFDIRIFIPIAIILFFSIYININAIKEIFCHLKNSYKNEKNTFVLAYKTIIFILILFFIFSLPFAIPKNFISESGFTNIFSHYIGYVFGVFAPLFLYLSNK
ncbi:MAG: hypothetical protein QW051_01420 [Candidatus Aenigmatarchaeota archaeon]